jgi:predicted metal-dependent hydrolase
MWMIIWLRGLRAACGAGQTRSLLVSTIRSYNDIRSSELKYHWGSCISKNNLKFNSRLSKAPIRVIEYVIVHELAYLP